MDSQDSGNHSSSQQPSNYTMSPSTQQPSNYTMSPSSQQPSNYTMSSQFANQFNPLNIPFQPFYHSNPTNGIYPSHVDQRYGSGFSFQNLLNTPVGYTQACDTTKERKKRVRDTQNYINSESSIAKKDWSREEEVALTKAWLYISEDADVGNNQKGPAMWNRILEAWKENMGDKCNIVRNTNSLQLKWSKIHNAVTKFNSLYARIERHPQSGTNVEDSRIHAMRSYEDLNETPFKFTHCWELMKKNPKWCLKEVAKTAAPSKEGVEHEKSATTGETVTNIGDDDEASKCASRDGVERPEGRKNCKEKKRKLNEEKGVMDALNKLQCTLEKQVSVNLTSLEMKRENEEKELKLREEVMRKELELKERAQKWKEEMQRIKIREQKRKEQDRLFCQDLSNLSPTRRAYYKLRKAEILKEFENDDPSCLNMEI